MNEAVIVSAVRTAVGKLGGALKGISAPQLGARVISEAVQRASLDSADVQECIMGIVLSAGTGQNPARQAALSAGLPVEIGSLNVNKICGSGLKSVMLASNSVRVGEHDVIVAGGMESMSSAPYLLMDGRFGYRLGDGKLVDHLVHDGLWDAPTDMHMGLTAEIVAERFNVTREQADELSYQSHMKAYDATKNGRFSKEILPITIKSKKSEIEFKEDEGIRSDTSLETLGKLKPSFKKDGIVTAGNASQISDGAAAVIVTSRKYAEEHGLKILASVVDYNTSGTKPEYIMEAPIYSTQALLARNNMTIDNIDLFEHNEAFATASVAVKKTLGVPDEKFNVNGGAVAIGHPIGCSGTRVLVSLIHALHYNNKNTGLATLCLGGGNAVSMIIQKE